MTAANTLAKTDICNIVVHANFDSLKGTVLSRVLNKFVEETPNCFELVVNRSIYTFSHTGTQFLSILNLIEILRGFNFDYYDKLVCIEPNYSHDSSIVDKNTKILKEVFQEIQTIWFLALSRGDTTSLNPIWLI